MICNVRRILFILVGMLATGVNLYANEVWINNSETIFLDRTPTFSIGTDSPSPQWIHWQVSGTPDFIEGDSVREATTPFSPSVSLPKLIAAELHEEEEYFYRIKVRDQNGWSEWTSPTNFLLQRSEAYTQPKHVSEETWKRLKPYFLPLDHPIRPCLEKIFSETRVTLSIKSLKKAGFIHPRPRKWTHLIVTKHPEVPGYVFKIYLDAQRYFKQKPEYTHWLERIHGVLAIENEIQTHNWEHTFKVPKKWIYPLPKEPSPPKDFMRKNFILVEEDMNIFDEEANNDKWKSDWVTTEKLDALYSILEGLGLRDCAKPDNIPFSKDGKIAFVDTQTFDSWPVNYKKLIPYLTPKMQSYWKQLTKKKKPHAP